MDSKIKEMLEKQLQLLSERSEEAILEELPNLTRAMIETATLLSGVRSQESPLDAVSSAVKACIRGHQNSDRASTELKGIPTNQLVEELVDRDGVEKIVLPPYQKSKFEAEGPAVVLMVTD